MKLVSKSKKPNVLPNMLKLERMRDIGGTPVQRGETLEEQKRWSNWECREEGEENPLKYMMYIHKQINVNH